MNRTAVAGGLLLAGSVVGYVVGIVVPYPGRAFSITGVIVGVTLLAIGSESGSGGGES